MNNKSIKVGDIVRLEVPGGCTLRAGCHSDSGFAGGLTERMVHILHKHNQFKVLNVDQNGKTMLLENGGSYRWDMRWFKKVEVGVPASYVPDTVYLNTDVMLNGNKTTVQILGRTGTAVRNKMDRNKLEMGVLIATARALGFDKEKVEQMIDVVYGDIRRLKDYSTEELLQELIQRERKLILSKNI